MAKYYLYILLALFLMLNGVTYFEKELKSTLKYGMTLDYNLKKQILYSSHTKEVKEILTKQKEILGKNSALFFKKNKKGTIVFSEIQSYIQSTAKAVNGKIIQLQSGTIIDNIKLYRKYPISLNLKLIPEDLDRFFKKLYSSEKYLFIDSLYVAANKRERILLLKITLSGYQLK